LLKETEHKQLQLKALWARGSPPKKAPRFMKKGKTLTVCSNLEIADGVDVVVNEDVDE
jgi:hypothetical protein